MQAALRVLLCALLLTLAMALPVLQAPAERLFGNEIVGRHHDAYTVIQQFERPLPLGHPLQQPVTDLSGAAVARLTGGVAAYNVIVLASFPLAALFAFLLARHLGLGPVAAAFAGLAYAFAPSHLAHAAYHPQIVQVQWIPLYFLTLARCLERWTTARAVALVAAAGLLGLASFYFGFFAAVLTPIALFAYPPGRAGATARDRWKTAATLGAAGLAGAVVLRLSPARLASLAEAFGFPAADLERYSARWYSYLLPPVDHPLAGDAVAAFWSRRGVADGLIEQQLTLGVALVLLALVGVVSALGGGSGLLGRRMVVFLSVMAAAALLLSFDPGAGALFHRAVPLFRAYARFGIFAQLMIALLAAGGLAILTRRGVRGRALAALLVALLAVEYAPFPPWRSHPVLPTEAHRWMAQQPGPWRLLDCGRLPVQVARSIFVFLPQPAAQASAARLDCAEPGAPAKLAALGFSHLLLYAGSAEDRWYAGAGSTNELVAAASFADSRLLAIAAPPADLYVHAWSGFSWREYRGDTTFRWLGGDGEWEVVNRGSEPATVVLEAELNAFPAARLLDLTVDGEVAATVEVATDPRSHRLGPLRLAPGKNRLGWRPRTGPTIADDVLGNGDERALSVAVAGWRWLRPPLDSAEAEVPRADRPIPRARGWWRTPRSPATARGGRRRGPP